MRSIDPRPRGRMSVRTKLVALILFVALVPLSVSAVTSLRVQQRAFDGKVSELQQTSADQGAAMVELMMANVVDRLAAIAKPIPWDQLSPQERAGALLLVYQQHPDIAIVQLNARDGQGTDQAVFRRNEVEHPDHPMGSTELVDAFAAALTIADGEPEIGALFGVDGGAMIAVAIPAGSHSLAIALSLRTVCRELVKLSPASLAAVLIAPSGELACDGLVVSDESRDFLRGSKGLVEHEQAGVAMRSAVAVAPSGFVIATQQPTSAATTVSRRLRLQSLFWIGLSLIVALFGGWFLSVEIRRPVSKLAIGAHKLAAGDLSYRIENLGTDEFGELATAFNAMGTEIEKRDAEIREWNVELQGRVDQRTRDLKDAQNQLLESQKLAAVSSLAAGLAHEVNNPLTAVLGLSQLLHKRAEKSGDSKSAKALASIDREAKRIGEIVGTLKSLSRESDTDGFATVALDEVINSSVKLCADRAKEAGLVIERDLVAALPAIRGVDQKLRQVVVELLNNSIIACSQGDVITVRTINHDHKLVGFEIADTGKGIRPENLDRVFEPFFTTKDNWEGRGLGLTVAHQIITEHRGTIRVASEPGIGTRVTVAIPIARAESQLT